MVSQPMTPAADHGPDTPSGPATGRDRPERWPLRAPPRLDRPRSDSRPPRRRGRARVPIRRPGRPPAAIGRNGGRRTHRDRPRRGRREMTVMRCATGHGRRRRFTDRRAKREYSHQRRQRGGRPLPGATAIIAPRRPRGKDGARRFRVVPVLPEQRGRVSSLQHGGSESLSARESVPGALFEVFLNKLRPCDRGRVARRPRPEECAARHRQMSPATGDQRLPTPPAPANPARATRVPVRAHARLRQPHELHARAA